MQEQHGACCTVDCPATRGCLTCTHRSPRNLEKAERGMALVQRVWVCAQVSPKVGRPACSSVGPPLQLGQLAVQVCRRLLQRAHCTQNSPVGTMPLTMQAGAAVQRSLAAAQDRQLHG